jgi:hypothetical protein
MIYNSPSMPSNSASNITDKQMHQSNQFYSSTGYHQQHQQQSIIQPYKQQQQQYQFNSNNYIQQTYFNGPINPTIGVYHPTLSPQFHSNQSQTQNQNQNQTIIPKWSSKLLTNSNISNVSVFAPKSMIHTSNAEYSVTTSTTTMTKTMKNNDDDHFSQHLAAATTSLATTTTTALSSGHNNMFQHTALLNSHIKPPFTSVNKLIIKNDVNRSDELEVEMATTLPLLNNENDDDDDNNVDSGNNDENPKIFQVEEDAESDDHLTTIDNFKKFEQKSKLDIQINGNLTTQFKSFLNIFF